MSTENKIGFTLVEAIIAAVVIAALLAVLIPFMRERERQRLQALAESEPWEVFEFSARPAKESFSDREDVIVWCEIVNRTNYPLPLPKDRRATFLTFGDTVFFAASLGYVSIGSILDTPETTLASDESASFEVRFGRIGVGRSEFRVAYLTSRNQRRAGNIAGTTTAYGELTEENRFRSNAFQVLVNASGDSDLPTFDSIIADIQP